MKKALITLAALTLFAGIIYAQSRREIETVICYLNTDNFFNAENDSYSYDDEFTSGGKMIWGNDRYSEKINSLQKLLGNAFKDDMPDILILSEAEDKNIIEELLDSRTFRKYKYRLIFEDSSTGTSSAIVYRQGVITDYSLNKIYPDEAGSYRTDPIIHARLKLADNKSYHLFINNWPEKQAGKNIQKRVKCAIELRKEIDRILNFEREARIIVAGTFNAEPTERIMLNMLNASNKRKNLDYRDLYNPFYDMHNTKSAGTVSVNGSLQMYDYFILSPVLLKNVQNDLTAYNCGEILKAGMENPVPTYTGSRYTGGATKHFPVKICLNILPVKK